MDQRDNAYRGMHDNYEQQQNNTQLGELHGCSDEVGAAGAPGQYMSVTLYRDDQGYIVGWCDIRSGRI